MKSRINNSVTVLATGFVELLLLLLPLFCSRWICETILVSIMPRDYMTITIWQDTLVPLELEYDPNVVKHSEVKALLHTEEPPRFLCFGIIDYFQARAPAGYHSDIYYHCKDEDGEDWMYFDKRIGQIVCHYTYWKRIENNWLPKKVRLYAGPEGISENIDKKLVLCLYLIDG